ncbi:hypothetical protein ACYFX5_15525 [Bremerella sp. T1]|uniref:hypothetical protein n=1 Tax=Bremerella sp. TYQ1 TaxID=3119568 RepID=UPI001CCEBC5D|nr:hypothetical protein [Bremerella volcania]UBM34467.1 hypothetical protein LA756_17475 [Bremerella volcania]
MDRMNRLRRPTIVVVTVIMLSGQWPVSSAIAQDPSPRDEVRRELEEQKEKFNKILQDMRDKHLKATRELEQKVIEELKALARSEAGNGKIKEATETWTEVVRIDATDADANKFFKAIGREDIIRQQILKAVERQSPEPTQRVEWHGEKGLVFRRQSDGRWLETWEDKGELKRRVHVELGRTPYFIETFHDGGHFKLYQRIYGDRLFWRYANHQKWREATKGLWID